MLYADHPHLFRQRLGADGGRVGRSAEAPTGTVLFAASRRSPAMGEAVALIRELNEEAWRRGCWSMKLLREWGRALEQLLFPRNCPAGSATSALPWMWAPVGPAWIP